MRSLRRVTLVVAGLAAGTLAASGADIPVKAKPLHDRAVDHRRQRDGDPAAQKRLFHEFLDWLKTR
jgi:hypothetical protein